jgi:hypothetical protein
MTTSKPIDEAARLIEILVEELQRISGCRDASTARAEADVALAWHKHWREAARELVEKTEALRVLVIPPKETT